MPEYICKVGTESGEIIEEQHNAQDKKALKQELEQRGYYVFSIRPANLSMKSLKGSNKIKLDKFIIMNQEFKALLQAGLPVVKGLDILIRRQQETELGKMLKEVRHSVETGSSLAEAFAIHRHRLPTAYVTTMMAGERSGDLGEALGRFNEYAKLTNKLRNNFKKAIYYPAFLVGLSVILIGLMLAKVLPEFAKFYDGFRQELPWFTRMIMKLSSLVKDNLLLILLTIALLTISIIVWTRSTSGAKAWMRLIYSLPLVGPLLHKYHISQVFHSLSVMLQGGMPLVSSLDDLTDSVNNPVLRESLSVARTRVNEGDNFTHAVTDTMLATDLTVEMIHVGESTGALPEMLYNVATFYDEETKNKMDGLLALLEPTLLMIMAIIIGSLLFAMYYPLFNLLGGLGAPRT
jgi:type IV pilus assembly protein PilC